MVEEHRIPVTAEESVAAVHHPGTGDDWLFFCHGFLSDMTGSYEERCERAVAEGFDAVRFDFRGCGESDGTFVDQDLTAKVEDLRAVVDRFDPPSYVAFGSSFGAAVAFRAAIEDDRVEAVATRAPVTRLDVFEEYRDVVERDGEVVLDDGRAVDGRFLEDLERYDFDDVAAGLEVPVAVFHGTDDGSVPLTHSLEAARTLSTDVLLQTYADEGHRFSAAAETRMREQLFEWLATLPGE